MNKNLIIVSVLVIIALGGGFFAGMQYEKSKAPSLPGGAFMMGGNGQMRGRFGGGQNRAGFAPVRGQVLSIDSTGMTVKLSDGSSKIVVVAPSTLFVKSSSASASDVKSGDTVVVVGTQNSDGSVTAQNVQINPPMIRIGAPTGTQ